MIIWQFQDIFWECLTHFSMLARVRDNSKFEELFAEGSYDCAGSSKSLDHKSKKLESGSGRPAIGEGLPNEAASSSSVRYLAYISLFSCDFCFLFFFLFSVFLNLSSISFYWILSFFFIHISELRSFPLCQQWVRPPECRWKQASFCYLAICHENNYSGSVDHNPSNDLL